MVAPARRSVVARWLRRAARLPFREQITMLRVLVVVAVVELLIRWVPLPRLSRLLRVRLDLTSSSSGAPVLQVGDLPTAARRSLRGTARVTRHWPFCSGPCLRSALVGAHLVRKLDPAVRIGVAGVGGGLRAHAWIEIDSRPIESVTAFVPFQRQASA